MFGFGKKKVPVEPPQSLPVEAKPEPKVELGKLSNDQKIELISSQIEAMNERIKNVERMVEEIYKIAKR